MPVNRGDPSEDDILSRDRGKTAATPMLMAVAPLALCATTALLAGCAPYRESDFKPPV
jgi:hypothetical protein